MIALRTPPSVAALQVATTGARNYVNDDARRRARFLRNGARMLDVLFCAVTLVFFAASIAYASACERL